MGEIRKKTKKVPSYWWDFKWVNNDIYSIIVQSDCYDDPVDEFIIPSGELADRQIEAADKIIKEYVSGRKTPEKQH